MSQRLTLPLDDLRVTAGYKNPEYLAYWRFSHFGMDCTSPQAAVRACGDGEVIAAGQDGQTLTGAQSKLGNVIVLVYRDVLCADGKTRDLACRMYHFASVAVKPGERVTRGQVIGQYGNTGANTSGPHLHIEFDADIHYPTLAYGVKIGGRIINTAAEFKRAGGLADSTINPANLWFAGPGQSVKAAAASWSVPGDLAAPALPEEQPDYRALYEDATARYNALLDELAALGARRQL